MDNHNNEQEQQNPCTEIKLLIPPREKDLGDGFHVRRLIPHVRQRMVGPWIFFDHMGPATLTPEDHFDVRPHPHINLATVTYLFEGEIFHQDSLDNHLYITPGEINLMVAGKGITHSERERPETKKTHRKIHGLQLWLALPEEYEEIDPAFYHYTKQEIPSLEVNGVPVRVMMGQAYGKKSPVKTFCETLYIEARLQKGQSLTLPQAQERALYVAEGDLKLNSVQLNNHHMAILNDCEVKLTATEDSYIALIGGEAFSTKRFIDWNFVSSRKERIQKAKEDWKAQRFPKIPNDSEEFIPLPEY